MVVIGSKALSYHIGVPRRINDLDLVGTYDQAVEFRKRFKATSFYPIQSGKSIFMRNAEGKICEIEVAWEGSRAEKLMQFMDEHTSFYDTENEWWVPEINVLYLLKMSQRFLKNSAHFKKTMDDILFMRGFGAKVLPEHESFLKEREAMTYDYGHPKLNRTKDEFFSGDGIVYEWSHDDIHEAVKFFDVPAYQFFSGGEVWSDMKKFMTLPEEIKLHAVLEESIVLAAERSQLCFRGVDPDWSFNKALEKVCTSITSGRFREYAYENYYKVLELYSLKGRDYMERVNKGIQEGVIKKLNAK